MTNHIFIKPNENRGWFLYIVPVDGTYWSQDTTGKGLEKEYKKNDSIYFYVKDENEKATYVMRVK